MNARLARPLACLCVSLTLISASLACGGSVKPTAAPARKASRTPVAGTIQPKPRASKTPKPTKTTAPAAEIEVISAYGYKDTVGYYNVVGLLQNNLEMAAYGIELTIEIKDAQGQTLLRDKDDKPINSTTFSPAFNTVPAGKQVPYSYNCYVGKTNPAGASYTVTVTDYQETEAANVKLEVLNTQIASDGSAGIYLTGEIVNAEDTPIDLYTLAGALLNEHDLVIAVTSYATTARILAPAGDAAGLDRSPFRIQLNNPDDAGLQWRLYWSAAPVTSPSDYDVSVEALTSYADRRGQYHVVAQITNNTQELLSIRAIAGLYTEAGIVLDADQASLPLYFEPGAVYPVDAHFFSNVNYNDAETSKIDTWTIQIDPGGVYVPSRTVVTLETAEDSIPEIVDGKVTYTGSVTNTSTENLSAIHVLVYLQDPQDNIVAAATTSVYPDEAAIAPGAVSALNFTFYAPAEVTADYTFTTVAQGIIK